jgi:hypothetical protein
VPSLRRLASHACAAYSGLPLSSTPPAGEGSLRSRHEVSFALFAGIVIVLCSTYSVRPTAPYSRPVPLLL